MLDVAFGLTDEGWRIILTALGGFLSLSGRTQRIHLAQFCKAFWVNFKVFGMLTLMLFIAAQFRLITKYKL